MKGQEYKNLNEVFRGKFLVIFFGPLMFGRNLKRRIEASGFDNAFGGKDLET
jgi:hypothetical protein